MIIRLFRGLIFKNCTNSEFRQNFRSLDVRPSIWSQLATGNFANPNMASLIGQRLELTRHLITTLVALNEVNQELEKLFSEREKHLLTISHHYKGTYI